jgi:hypothetical protein
VVDIEILDCEKYSCTQKIWSREKVIIVPPRHINSQLEEKMAVESSENVGVALGLVCGAGLATGLGAAVVFFPSLVKLASKRVLAASLGFSSGVMVYVSFIEIFQKSSLSFEDAGHDEDKAYVYATLCFFGGVLVMTVRVWASA